MKPKRNSTRPNRKRGKLTETRGSESCLRASRETDSRPWGYVRAFLRRPWLVTFSAALCIYIATMAPTITGEDSGELISSAYLMGVAHPPGYPLWCLIGKLFTLFPISNVAVRVNFMSAVFGAMTAATVAAITFQLVRHRAAAVCAGLCLAFSELMWSQSIIAEVYTLNTFCLAFIVYLLFLWERNRRGALLLAVAILYGLSCGNHPTMWPLGALFAAFVLYTDPRFPLRRPKLLTVCVTAFALCWLVYAYLPIRSAANTYMDWGNPESIKDTLFHVLRKQYPSSTKENPRNLALFGRQMGRLLHFLIHQFTPALAVLVPVGFLCTWRRKHLGKTLLLTSIFGATTVGFVYMTNFKIERQEIMVNSVFFISAMPIAAIWLGIGMRHLINAGLRLKRAIALDCSAKALAAVASLIVILIPLLTFYAGNDKSRYYFAYDYGVNLLETLDKDAILFPSGDHSSFTVMYLQAVEERRPDVTVADKYGYIERSLYKDMGQELPRFPSKQERTEIESWIIAKTDRPVYFTTKRNMADLPGYDIRPVGLMFRVLRPKEQLGPEAKGIWDRYAWRNLGKLHTSLDYTAKVILSDLHYFRGLDHLEKNRSQAAVQEFHKTASYSQEMKEVFNNLGSACAEKGLYGEALDFFKTAVTISPGYLTGHRNLSFLCKQLGKNDEAIQHFRAAAKLAPMNLTYPMELAVLLEARGENDEAISIFEELARKDAKNYFFFRRLALLYWNHARDREAAIRSIKRALELNSDQDDLRALLAKLAPAAGDGSSPRPEQQGGQGG